MTERCLAAVLSQLKERSSHEELVHLNVGATALDSESAIGESMTDSEPDHEVPAVFAEVPRFQVVTVPGGCATVLYPPDPTVPFVRIEVGTTVQQLLEAESRVQVTCPLSTRQPNVLCRPTQGWKASCITRRRDKVLLCFCWECFCCMCANSGSGAA